MKRTIKKAASFILATIIIITTLIPLGTTPVMAFVDDTDDLWQYYKSFNWLPESAQGQQRIYVNGEELVNEKSINPGFTEIGVWEFENYNYESFTHSNYYTPILFGEDGDAEITWQSVIDQIENAKEKMNNSTVVIEQSKVGYGEAFSSETGEIEQQYYDVKVTLDNFDAYPEIHGAIADALYLNDGYRENQGSYSKIGGHLYSWYRPFGVQVPSNLYDGLYVCGANTFDIKVEFFYNGGEHDGEKMITGEPFSVKGVSTSSLSYWTQQVFQLNNRFSSIYNLLHFEESAKPVSAVDKIVTSPDTNISVNNYNPYHFANIDQSYKQKLSMQEHVSSGTLEFSEFGDRNWLVPVSSNGFNDERDNRDVFQKNMAALIFSDWSDMKYSISTSENAIWFTIDPIVDFPAGVEKFVNNKKETSAETGDTLHYKIIACIPDAISKSYSITDYLPEGITIIEDSFISSFAKNLEYNKDDNTLTIEVNKTSGREANYDVELYYITWEYDAKLKPGTNVAQINEVKLDVKDIGEFSDTAKVTPILRGNVDILHKDIDTGEILNSGNVKTGEKVGTEYSTSKENFDGYKYVKLDKNSAPANGTVKEETQTVIYLYEKIKGSVKVVHKDIDTGEVLVKEATVKDNVPIGENYSTSVENITDYEFIKLADDSAPKSGTVEEGTKTVTYLYRRHTGSVMVEHRDIETGELLTDPESVKTNERVGTDYQTSSSTFDNYEFVRHDGQSAPESGTVKKDTQTVVYLYKHDKGNVTVVHKDIETGKEIATRDEVAKDVNTGTEYTSSNKDIEGYRFAKWDDTSDDVSGKVETTDKTVVYLYERIRGSVIAEYRDIDTGEVIADPLQVAKDIPTGESYETSEIEVPHYAFIKWDDTSDDVSGTINEGTKTVVFLYQKNKGSVTVEHRDIFTGEVLDEGVIADNIPVDSEYTASSSTFDGYRFIKWDEKSALETGYVTEETQSVVYLYAKEYTEHYAFESGAEGIDLPDDVVKLLPTRADLYINGDEVLPITIETTEVPAEGGVWKFRGWNKESHIIDNADAYFIGIWDFVKAPVISVEKTVDKDIVKPNEKVTFTITATAADNDAINAVVTDPAVKGIEIDTATIKTNYDNAIITIDDKSEGFNVAVEKLLMDKPLIITFDATITIPKGDVTNIAHLTAYELDDVSDDAKVTVVPEETTTEETTTPEETTTEETTTQEETTIEPPTTPEEITTQKETPVIKTTITKIIKGEAPKTGDESNVLLWVIIAMLSLGAGATILVSRKHKHE